MKQTAIITVGHDVNNVPTFTTPEVCEYVTQYLHVEAFTAIPCFGMWQGQREDSTRIEICALDEDDAETIRANVPVLAQALNQQAIMFELRVDQVEFIERETVAAIQTA